MSIKKLLKILIFILLLIQVNVYALNKAVVDVTQMDITELSKALELKLITSEELINLYLDRIKEYDKQYNSIININEKALEEAKQLDQERSNGKVRSSLHGIPILVKDNIDVSGLPTTGGAKALKDNYPKDNAFAIQKLIDAGAIVLAKTNMSEFAFYASSSYSSYGSVKNAYNVDYSSYGSSGGSAVALAASFATAALGTDTNASVRLPASANNLIGLRPTVGLISRTGVLPYDIERDTIGPITKTVADSILLMNIINGYDAKDYKSINQEDVKYNTTSQDLKEITIGIPTNFMKGDNKYNLKVNKETNSEITKLMETAVDKMKSAGAKIVYIDEYYTMTTDSWYSNALSGYTFCNGFNEYIKGTVGKIRNFNDLAFSKDKVTGLAGYLTDCGRSNEMPEKDSLKDKYTTYISEIMAKDNIDVIVYPSTKNKLVLRGKTDDFINVSYHASSTINYPSITLPLGFDKDGLAYGIEFMAPTNQENLLFDVANVYEKINGNDITPQIAPSLYEIPEDVLKLVDNYKVLYNKKLKSSDHKNWIESSSAFFRGYSENEKVVEDAKKLNQEYSKINTKEVVLKPFLNIIKWFFVILVTLVILLLIRKKIRRIIRKRKKRKK